MAYYHHSHVTCDNCGERHTPGSPEECIETLLDTIDTLKELLREEREDKERLQDLLEEKE